MACAKHFDPMEGIEKLFKKVWLNWHSQQSMNVSYVIYTLPLDALSKQNFNEHNEIHVCFAEA